ncbi:unnamed protein product [Penicillium palitans]
MTIWPHQRPDSVSSRRRHRADEGDPRHPSRAGPAASVVCGGKHEEVVKLLRQTHSEELMAVKAGYEKESVKETSTVKAEAEAARAQQREAAERAAQEGSRLKEELAAKEEQLGELQTANAQTAW